jgi:hypothetical protein
MSCTACWRPEAKPASGSARGAQHRTGWRREGENHLWQYAQRGGAAQALATTHTWQVSALGRVLSAQCWAQRGPTLGYLQDMVHPLRRSKLRALRGWQQQAPSCSLLACLATMGVTARSHGCGLPIVRGQSAPRTCIGRALHAALQGIPHSHGTDACRTGPGSTVPSTRSAPPSAVALAPFQCLATRRLCQSSPLVLDEQLLQVLQCTRTWRKQLGCDGWPAFAH